jgi:hypothetical protein
MLMVKAWKLTSSRPTVAWNRLDRADRRARWGPAPIRARYAPLCVTPFGRPDAPADVLGFEGSAALMDDLSSDPGNDLLPLHTRGHPLGRKIAPASRALRRLAYTTSLRTPCVAHAGVG